MRKIIILPQTDKKKAGYLCESTNRQIKFHNPKVHQAILTIEPILDQTQIKMTKKQKEDELSMLQRHQSQQINQQEPPSNPIIVKNPTNKKSIKKPQLSLSQKIDLLKDKNHKVYKHAEKKIDRMIEIIDEITQKNLSQWVKENKTTNQLQGGDKKIQEKLQQPSNSKDSPSQSEEEKALVAKTLSYLHNLLTYEKPLSHIKKQFESFYARLSTFSKQLQSQQQLPQDKKFLVPENGLTFEQTRLIQQLIKEHFQRTGLFHVAQLFDHYGKEDETIHQEHNPIQSISNLSNKSRKNSKKITKQNSLNKQKQQTKTVKSPKKRPKVELIDLQQNFRECFILRNQLLTKNFEQAIQWCVQQRLYQTHSNPLEYDLRLTEIKQLIREEKYHLAYEKIERDMGKFLDNFQEQLNLLIGFLLFSCQWDSGKVFIQQQIDPSHQTNNQPQHSQPETQLFSQMITQRYSRFLINSTDIQHIARKFTHEYFIHYDISQFDTLEICYKVGKMYEQQYFQSIQMFSEKDRQEFLKHRNHCDFNEKTNGVQHSIILPFEIPVEKEHLYHSIFVCPVTKQVLSSNDGVQLLSCGHLVSQSAKKNMAEVRRSNHKQKCPVCQKDRTSDVIKVSF